MFLRQEPQGPFSLLCADHIVVGEGRRFVEETVFVKGYEAGQNLPNEIIQFPALLPGLRAR